MTLFDIDQARVDELTSAFRAGEHRGRRALRDELDAAEEHAWRQGYETAALHACLLAGCIVFWWFVGRSIVLPLVGWLT